MLNEKTLCVFDAVMKYLEGGGYVVIAKNDILSQLAQPITKREADECINALQLDELIKIRYADNEVYCLTVLPKGVIEYDRRKEITKEREEREKQRETEKKEIASEKEIKAVPDPIVVPKFDLKKTLLLCFFSAFFGAFVAGMITLAVIISKLK